VLGQTSTDDLGALRRLLFALEVANEIHDEDVSDQEGHESSLKGGEGLSLSVASDDDTAQHNNALYDNEHA